MATTSSPILFTFNTESGVGFVRGGGWGQEYQGFTSALACWMFVSGQDGFCLAPGASLEIQGAVWRARVVR